MSQPAVTQALGKLERQIGSPLFVRHSGGMQPTEAGLVLARRVEAMLDLLGTRHATSVQVRAFLALARAGTYPAAAELTGLSQASLHRAVADLAVALGYPLLERRGRSLLLNQRGREAVRRFSLAMVEIEAALVEMRALAGRETGRIAIGAMPLSRSRLLPEAIATFHAAHPDVELAIVEGSYGELVGPLRDGQIAVMLGALRDELAPDLTSQPLFRDQPIIVGRKDHPLTVSGDLSGRSLASYSWLVPARGTPLRALWLRMFELLGVEAPPIMIECGSVMTIRQLLMVSDQLTLLSPDQVAVELEAGWLERVGAAPDAVNRTIGMTTRTGWRPTPLEDELLSTLKVAAGQCGMPIIRKN